MGLAERAEYLAELAGEAETKKEADELWKEYKHVMIAMTGDKNLFRKKKDPTSKPSKALRRTIKNCECGFHGISWSRKIKKYIMECKCGDNYGSRSGKCLDGNTIQWTCGCGVSSSPQRTGPQVKFSCPGCKKETNWCWSNSEARDEWNKL